MNIIDKILDKLPEWVTVVIIFIILTISVIKFNKIIKFLRKGLFGPDGNATYTELTGALGFFTILGMVITHFIDRTYSPDLELLIFCGIIVLTTAKLDKALDIFDKYISAKINNNIKSKEINKK